MNNKIHLLFFSALLLCSCATVSKSAYDERYQDNEAINVGYGRVRKSDLTGSVSKIKVKEEDVSNYQDVYDYLRSRVPGLEVQGSGSNAVVRIRGERSLIGSNDPLWIVDGQECTDISFIVPSFIQSVEVLKDASATAVYGSRGANGVILITLKH